MKGLCENCVKQDTCKKTIGIMFGFCNTDFEAEKEEKKMTVRDLLAMNIEIDVCDDYDESCYIAFVGDGYYPLTLEGEKKFGRALDVEIEMGEDIVILNTSAEEETEDESERRTRACKNLFYSLAGYCDDSDYHKWFNTYEGKHYVDEIVYHNSHQCKVTKVWHADGKDGISIIPTGGYGFEIDIYEEQLGEQPKKMRYFTLRNEEFKDEVEIILAIPYGVDIKEVQEFICDARQKYFYDGNGWVDGTPWLDYTLAKLEEMYGVELHSYSGEIWF